MRVRKTIPWVFVLLNALLTVRLAIEPLKRQGEAVGCRKTMSSIAIAAQLWANEHQELFPRSLEVLSNEVGVTRILICPADHSRQPASSWANITSSNCSYEIITPNLSGADKTNIFLRCKIHGYLAFADSRVVDGSNPQPRIP